MRDPSISSGSEVEEKSTEIETVVREEMESGMYLRWDIHNTIGQKP